MTADAPDGSDTRALRVRIGWALALLLIGGLGFTACYDGVVAPIVIVLAVVVPFALVRGGIALRLGSFVPAMVVVVLAAGVAWLVLGGSIGDAMPTLLTSPRPVTVTGELLAPAAVLVAVTAAVVAGCVLARGPGDAVSARARVAGLIAPVLGAAVLYTAAQLLSAGSSDRHGIVAACLLLVVVVGWSTPVVRSGRVAWRPAAVAPVAATVVLALGAATLVPSGAFDPSRHVSPPTVRLTASSPMTQLASWMANPSVEIFRTHTVGTNRLHLATLSRYTGATWEVDDRYRAVGLTGEPDLPAGRVQAQASATVQISRLGSVWVPSVGVATGSSLSGALVDSDDGTLAVAAGARPGLRYDVRATVDAPDNHALEIAPTPTTVPSRYVELPGAPKGFAQYARAAIRGASTPLEEAVAVEHAVSTGRTVSTTAPSGTSYSRLETFLFTPAGRAGAQQGSAEQFAAAFAVLAREVGLPTRLVVGFDVPAANSNGTSVVRGKDATVWPEVYFGGAGWVPFAPTPGGGGGADAGLRDTVLQHVATNAASSPLPAPIKAGNTVKPSTGHVVAHPKARAAAADDGLPGWVIAVAVVVVLLALLIGGLLALRARRSARHRKQGAPGAWAEFQDLLVLLGRRPAASDAAPAIAAGFDEDFPSAGTRAAGLAHAADRASFAPDPDRAAAPQLWRDVRVLRRRARGSVPRYRRALWPVDPRPLLRR